MAHLVRHVCPDCNKLIGLAIPVADGSLGSSIYCCKHCEGETRSEHTEWARFDRQSRKAFIYRSMLLSLAIGATFTFLVFLGLLLTGNLPTRRLAAYIVSAFFLITGSTAAVQGFRVFASLQRDAEGDLRASHISLFSFESNVFVRLMIPFLAAVVIFGLAFLR